MPDNLQPETIAASAGVASDRAFNAVSPPLHLSATYGWRDPLEKPPFDYSRSGNPTRAELERALCRLEGAERGVITATGMAAIDLVLNLVNPGDTVIAPHDCYGGTFRLLSARARRGHFAVEFVDQTDANALADALQQPLALGCDVVVHSTTKYINGHSDVVGGAVLAADKALGEELAWWANATGVTGAPFDSFLTLRGLRTLFTRIERQQDTASEIAAALIRDDRVARVFYPGLAGHRGHDIARRQQRGFGAMLSVEFAGDVEVLALLRRLSIFTIAESLGGFESLVCTPATMTHASMTPEARGKAGISDRLVRFSIGLEHSKDLLRDLFAALDAVLAPAGANVAAFRKPEDVHAR